MGDGTDIRAPLPDVDAPKDVKLDKPSVQPIDRTTGYTSLGVKNSRLILYTADDMDSVGRQARPAPPPPRKGIDERILAILDEPVKSTDARALQERKRKLIELFNAVPTADRSAL